MVFNQNAAGGAKTGAAEADDNELRLMQTLHHVLAIALFNGYQNEMVLPITSAEVPRRASARVQPQARN